jgi:sporulation and cell division protein SsgA
MRSRPSFAWTFSPPPAIRSLDWCALTWQVSNPYAVELLFVAGGVKQADVTWLLSRELLAEGLSSEAGWGDVRLGPDPRDPDALVLRLESPAGKARFRFAARPLAEFLDATLRHVPLGWELLWVPIDAEITALLEGGARL